MIANIKSFSNKLGIDGAIAYTVLARLIQAGGGVISIIFIAKYLSKVEQGYYFTFGSLLAVQIFFELGLSNIITQFVAHENAHLHFKSNIELEGSENSKSRLSSLLRFCVTWFSVIAILLVIILLITGYVFFKKYGTGSSEITWRLPWVILSVSTALSLMISPVLAFLEGLGKVKDVAFIRLLQQVCQLFGLFFFLVSGFKLFSSPLASVITFMIAPSMIIFSYKWKLLRSIWHQSGEAKVNYRLEIFPYQWRIALSWMSGYFIFQLFNPVLFATDGPEVAGQMGMTLAALNGVLSISLSWINTKVPLFSSLIAKEDFINLDVIFNKTLKQACLICAVSLALFLGTVFLLRYFQIAVGNRFLPMLPLFLLCTTTFINQLIGALATYLRCHKQEPFLIQSIVMGVLTALSTLLFARLYGVLGITSGYCFITVSVGLTWSLLIFKRKKAQWHK